MLKVNVSMMAMCDASADESCDRRRLDKGLIMHHSTMTAITIIKRCSPLKMRDVPAAEPLSRTNSPLCGDWRLGTRPGRI